MPHLVLYLSPGVFLMPSEPQPENLSAEELQKLSSELSELSRQHAKALEDDVFMGLTKERIAEFERRRNRISELCEIVGKANYSDPKPSNTELRHYRLPLLRSQMWQIKSAVVPTAATVRPFVFCSSRVCSPWRRLGRGRTGCPFWLLNAPSGRSRRC